MLGQCASLCVDNAQQMISLIDEHYRQSGTTAIIPWWYRVFYLYVSGTVLIAAALRTDLFTSAVSQSWSKVIWTLQAHSHLSPFVQQCIVTFQTLSSKIEEMHNPGRGQSPTIETSGSSYFQDAIQDIGFDPDSFLFCMEDMSWLRNSDTIS
jgi:hypothetical protein